MKIKCAKFHTEIHKDLDLVHKAQKKRKEKSEEIEKIQTPEKLLIRDAI